MQTLDEMRDRHLLSADQHRQIESWIAEAKTPQAILEMPAELWRSLELASKLLGFDLDMAQQPPLGGDAESPRLPSKDAALDRDAQ